MKIITKYQALDGKEFNIEEECIEYERMIDTLNIVMSLLHPLPEDKNLRFANGEGFIEQNKQYVKQTKISLLYEIKNHIDHKWIQQSIDNENMDPSYVGRLVDEYDIQPLKKAWYRICCIDKNNREWGQPYFSMHPEEGKQICLNNETVNK